MLRQENLSLEAEALRARYEAMLISLEKACQTPDQRLSVRHSSIIGNGCRGNACKAMCEHLPTGGAGQHGRRAR